MLDSRSADRVLQWERIDCQGIPPSSKDKLGVWVYKNKYVRSSVGLAFCAEFSYPVSTPSAFYISMEHIP